MSRSRASTPVAQKLDRADWKSCCTTTKVARSEAGSEPTSERRCAVVPRVASVRARRAASSCSKLSASVAASLDGAAAASCHSIAQGHAIRRRLEVLVVTHAGIGQPCELAVDVFLPHGGIKDDPGVAQVGKSLAFALGGRHLLTALRDEQ